MDHIQANAQALHGFLANDRDKLKGSLSFGSTASAWQNLALIYGMLFLLSHTLAQDGLKSATEYCCAKLLEKGPSSALIAATVLYSQRMYKEALDAVDKCLSSAQSQTAMFLKGCILQKGRLGDSIPLFQQ